MITPAYAQTMALYNRWQNASLYGAADTLSEEARRADRGAFFGSIHGTLNHLLWGDRIWMSRFAGTPKPPVDIKGSPGLMPDWQTLRREREATDAAILDWAAKVRPADLEGELTWFSGAIGREVTKPLGLLVAHMFNHQTHHRGQVHAMLTAAGAKPDATDLAFMPDGV